MKNIRARAQDGGVPTLRGVSMRQQPNELPLHGQYL